MGAFKGGVKSSDVRSVANESYCTEMMAFLRVPVSVNKSLPYRESIRVLLNLRSHLKHQK